MQYKMKMILFILTLFLSGCASVNIKSYYPEGKFSSKDDKTVQIFYNDPPRPHDVIGEMYIGMAEYLSNQDVAKMKVDIAAMGGDAAVCVNNQSCTESIIKPATDEVKITHYAGSPIIIGSKTSQGTVEHHPAVIQSNCTQSSNCKIIRFIDE